MAEDVVRTEWFECSTGNEKSAGCCTCYPSRTTGSRIAHLAKNEQRRSPRRYVYNMATAPYYRIRCNCGSQYMTYPWTSTVALCLRQDSEFARFVVPRTKRQVNAFIIDVVSLPSGLLLFLSAYKRLHSQSIAKRVFDNTKLIQNYESAKFLPNFSTNYRQTGIKRSKIIMQKAQIIQKKCISQKNAVFDYILFKEACINNK